jgi:hypothetical protein
MSLKIGYLDTSVAIAMAFDDIGGAFMARAVRSFDRLYSATLLETEFFCAAPEGIDPKKLATFLKPIRFVFPDTSLADFIQIAKDAGARGSAAVHHLATALYLFPCPSAVHFISADTQQTTAAARLGFQCEFM